MCGIAAIFAYDPSAPDVDERELTTIRDHMTARGPDGAGNWLDPRRRIGLGHRRLSIIDLSPAGAQPMALATDATPHSPPSYWITFNGEIYNYRALRAALEKKGHVFKSTSDTEVLLHLYAEHGDAMVNELRGMYAFAIWDGARNGLFLARDPFGIKPLYVADDGKTVRVASQVKALLAGGRITTTPDPAGHVGFFLWGYVPEPFTLYKTIRSVPAGTTLWVGQNGERREKTFCTVTDILSRAELNGSGSSPSTLNPQLSTSLRDSISHHLVADVPVGVFLSSGLDSTTIAALAAEQGGTLRTVTLGFEEFRGTPNDETPLAELVARQYGAQHQTIWVKRQDFHDHVERLFNAMDRPTTDGVNTYFVSLAAAHTSLKVALSGLGGDELFGGYPAFTEIPRVVNTLGFLRPGNAIGKMFRAISAPVLKRFTSPKYAGLLEYGGNYAGAYLLRRGMFMPWELPEILDPEIVRQGWADLQPLARLDESLDGLSCPRAKVSALEMEWYMRNQLLRDSDWAGMAHSIEIRVPFVDVALLRSIAPSLATLPPTKRDMALSPLSPLPSPILDRPKTGFQIPVRQWLLRDDTLVGPRSRERGLRGWAREVHSRFADDLQMHGCTRKARQRVKAREAPSASGQPHGVRVLMLLSDGFGGFGGIAKFNRDFMTSVCSHPRVSEMIALPRLMPHDPGTLPPKLRYVTESLGGKWRYLRALRKFSLSLRDQDRSPDVIICGHVNLLPAAFLTRRTFKGKPVYLIVHGVDAWQPTGSPMVNACVRRVDGFIAVSNVTRQRFSRWAKLRADQGMVLPNCVELSAFAPGPKPPALLDRYRLKGQTVLMTLGRLASAERYKGFDEVLEIMPRLAKKIPNLAYLIAGDGPDRERLVVKAARLGMNIYDANGGGQPHPAESSPRVVFAGRISDREKADHYRLADAYVMPSSGEGFGIVFLEALACGIPVIGSRVDGSREALLNGRLGLLVDPSDPAEIESAVLKVLRREADGGVSPANGRSDDLLKFSFQNYERRVHAILDAIV